MEPKEISNVETIDASEIKRAFLASAISDISTYIQLADTKVSIMMGSLIALIAGILACYEPISQAISAIRPCSWLETILNIFVLLNLISTVAVFVFGILTIRGHISVINYKSKWFLSQSSQEYSFDAYMQDLQAMKDKDIIENMGAELYKLNDINRQKSKTMSWAFRLFAVSLSTVAVIGLLLLVNTL